MKIRMLKSLSGTVDGKRIEPLAAGQVVELDAATAKKYISSSLAEEYKEPAPDISDGEKDAPSGKTSAPK